MNFSIQPACNIFYSQFSLNLWATSEDKMKPMPAFSNHPFAGEKPISFDLLSRADWEKRESKDAECRRNEAEDSG